MFDNVVDRVSVSSL